MTVVETKLRKWGNSFGVVIPMDVVEKEGMKEDENVRIIVVKNSREAFRKTFGMLKGRLRKSSQQMKDELRRELYSD